VLRNNNGDLMNKKILIITAMIGIFCCSAQAAPLQNGISVHSELGKEQFIAALFATTLSESSSNILIAQEEKQIQVRILADRLSSRRFKRMWIEGMAINAATSELEKQSKNMAAFSNMIKVSLVRGDIFAVQRDIDSVKVSINGATLGQIDDPVFFDLLLRTWIGPVPLSSRFRDDLLVAGNIDSAIRDRFNQIRPSDERITAVATALLQRREGKKAKPTNVKAPQATIAQPKLAPAISKPIVMVPTVIQQAPSIDQSTNEAPKVVEVAEPDEPITLAIAPTSMEPIIEEDDEEEFTAESLLRQQLYIRKLKSWTNKYIQYPTRSIDRNEQGLVRLNININRDGGLVGTDMIEESKHSRLNKAALKAVKKASPYPAVPEEIRVDGVYTFSLPIVFKLMEQ
jgi:protein TonB